MFTYALEIFWFKIVCLCAHLCVGVRMCSWTPKDGGRTLGPVLQAVQTP